jgi:serine/threonine protein kinase
MSKLLSQGGFGCVYYPGITCKGKVDTNKSVVTKIQQDNINSKNEENIGKIVKTIKNFKLYFMPIVSHCPIHLAAINQEILHDCEIISKDRDNDFKYTLMSIPYVKNKSFFSFLTEFDKSKKYIIRDMTHTYEYLLNCVDKLINLDIVHYDLKSENILYNLSTNNPIIIDFGISIPMKELTEDNLRTYFYIYAPDYYIWSLEIHFINYLLHKTENELTLSDVETICKEIISNNKALDIFSKDFQKKYLNACIDNFKKYVNKQRMKVIHELKESYKTWDNYAVSVLYLRILGIMYGDIFHENEFIVRFSQLLLENINPSFEKRNSITKTIKTFQDMLYMSKNIDDYVELVESFTNDKKLITKRIKENQKSLPNIQISRQELNVKLNPKDKKNHKKNRKKQHKY